MSSAADRPELNTALERFYALSPRDQLAAFELIREYLGASAPETKHDRELRERAESLAALEKVATQVGLPKGRGPTTTQFKAEAPDVAPEWNVSRVTRLWGRWRFAVDAYEGRRMRATADQIALRLGEPLRPYSEEECLNALRTWLASEPRRATMEHYTRWHIEYNDRLPAGERRLPSSSTIKNRLQVWFDEALKVARGEVELAEAQRNHAERVSRGRRHDWTRTEHDLVGIQWVARCAGTAVAVAARRTHQAGFPPPALTLGKRRAWLREDVESYYHGEPLSEREANWLQPLYLSSVQAAAMVGRDRGALLLNLDTLPKPAGRVAGELFFLRSEVEQWVRDNPEFVGRPRAGRRPRSAPPT